MLKKLAASVLITSFLLIPTANAVRDTHGFIEFAPEAIEATDSVILPGQSSPLVVTLKDKLSPCDYDLVEYTQKRPGVKEMYDGKLEILVQTLCEFCQYDNPMHRIDSNICYIIDHLNELSEAMVLDIQSAYMANLRAAGRWGSLPHEGQVYAYYGFTQTDSDWDTQPYPYGSDYSRTMASSACGPTAMSIILSFYFHKEILPTEVAQYSLDNGYRLAYGTSRSLFASAARAYGVPEPVLANDINAVFRGVHNEGHMAIAAMSYGHFTHGRHFVAIVGAKVINGVEYFLIADPNYLNPRYYDLGSALLDDDPSDPFVWASKAMIANECNGMYWFQTSNFKGFTPNFWTWEDEVLRAFPQKEPAVVESETETVLTEAPVPVPVSETPETTISVRIG